MAKDDRSNVNPFTGKSHFDIVNDDKFLEEWTTQNAGSYGMLPIEDYPDVTIENSPIEIELKLKQ